MGRAFRFLLFVVAAGVLLAVSAGALPSGTNLGSIAIRAVAGLGVGGVLVFFVWRALRSLTDPPPPSPPTLDARATDVVYECATCGTRLRLEVAATGKAPRHCGEEMEPKLSM